MGDNNTKGPVMVQERLGLPSSHAKGCPVLLDESQGVDKCTTNRHNTLQKGAANTENDNGPG